MKSASKNRIALLIIDAIILMFCIFGVYRLTLKPYLPFNVISENSYFVISRIYQEQSLLAVGDTVISIDGYKFSHWEEIEFYTDAKNIDEKINVNYLSNGRAVVTGITLTQYYTTLEIIIISFVGLIFIFLAIFVALKSDDKSALIFHWASIGLAMVIMMTSGNYSVEPSILSLINHCLFLFAFTLTPVLFIHFTCTFTSFSSAIIKKIIISFYFFAALLAGYLCLLYFDARQMESFSTIHRYIQIYTYVFRPFLLLSVLIALLIFYKAYRRADQLVTRRKLNWILLGFLIGPSAFILFWALPFIFFGYPLMTEAIMHLLLISVPVTFAIAIVKYQLLDIDFIINRSVVYAIVISGLAAIYILLFTLFTLLIKGMEDTIPAVISAVIVVVFMNPIKVRVQKFVDRKFFRVEYNYREEQKRFLVDIKNANDIRTLSKKIVIHTDALIPVDKIGFFNLGKPENRVSLLAHKGFEILVGRSLKFDEENLKTDLSLPVAVDNKVEPGTSVESADLKIFRRWGMVLVFPIKSPSGEIHGFIVMGTKKSGAKYYQEDVDLLNSVSATTALTIDRIKLQEELIIEHLEAERLEEINKLKSFFMQIITHDMNQPVTNIKLYSELLLNNDKSLPEKFKKRLKTIHGENELLTRLIKDILDYSMIEESKKTYQMIPIDISPILSDAVNSMQYQFTKTKQKLELINERKKIIIKADAVAIERAIINLLSNAVKYSGDGGKTTISLVTTESEVGVQVVDQGSGIPEENLINIFEPFTRITTDTTKKAEGTGLGLAVVKHVMTAHCGRVDVNSKPKKGSTFTLWFPISNE